MNALSSSDVISVKCGTPFKKGYGAMSVVTVVAKTTDQLDFDKLIDEIHDVFGSLPDAAENLAMEFDSQEVEKARVKLHEMPAHWYSLHFELQLV